MKRIVYLVMALMLVLTSFSFAEEGKFKKGDPSASFDDRIVLPDDTEVPYNKDRSLLFLNGTLITGYDCKIINGSVFIPLEFANRGMGANLVPNKKKTSLSMKKNGKEIRLNVKTSNKAVKKFDQAVMMKDKSIYVPLRFVADKLGYTIAFSSKNKTSGRIYYETKKPIPYAKTFVPGFMNIIIDEKYNFSSSLSKEEALKEVKKQCLAGYENFSKSIRKDAGDQLDKNLAQIEKEINRMVYVGEVSRFYKFTMGNYDILFDRTDSKMFFIIHSSSTDIVEVDLNSPSLYTPVFITG